MANIERKRGATSKESKLPLNIRESKGRDSRSEVPNLWVETPIRYPAYHIYTMMCNSSKASILKQQ